MRKKKKDGAVAEWIVSYHAPQPGVMVVIDVVKMMDVRDMALMLRLAPTNPNPTV